MDLEDAFLLLKLRLDLLLLLVEELLLEPGYSPVESVSEYRDLVVERLQPIVELGVLALHLRDVDSVADIGWQGPVSVILVRFVNRSEAVVLQAAASVRLLVRPHGAVRHFHLPLRHRIQLRLYLLQLLNHLLALPVIGPKQPLLRRLDLLSVREVLLLLHVQGRVLLFDFQGRACRPVPRLVLEEDVRERVRLADRQPPLQARPHRGGALRVQLFLTARGVERAGCILVRLLMVIHC